MHTDKSAMSALMAAASNGSIAITTTLLDAGADINLRNSDGVTALMHASVLGHVSLVEFLLDSGADLQARRDYISEIISPSSRPTYDLGEVSTHDGGHF